MHVHVHLRAHLLHTSELWEREGRGEGGEKGNIEGREEGEEMRVCEGEVVDTMVLQSWNVDQN